MKNIIKILLLSISFIACKETSKPSNNQYVTIDVSENSIVKEKKDSIVGFDDMFISEKQEFTINVQRAYSIIGEHGTKITFPKFCFGDSVQEVFIELIECYDFTSMIKSGLSTLTGDNKLLETEGMVYLSATNKLGDSVFLNKSISLEIPTAKKKKNFHVFNGSLKNTGVIWNLSNSKIVDKKQDVVVVMLPVEGESITQEEPVIESYSERLYQFSSKKLGWINVDKYYQSTEQGILSIKTINHKPKTLYYILFDDFNILLQGRNNNNEIDLINGNQIPLHMNITIIAINKIIENKYSLGILSFKTDNTTHFFPKLDDTYSEQELDFELISKLGNNISSRSKK